MHMTLPADRCTAESSIVDWADAPRYSWYGPEHLYRRLAGLNRDARAQYFAGKAVRYDATSSWLNLIWYDPSVSSVLLPSTPTFRHFENMGLVASRTDWNGDEAMTVFRCGAPLGTFAGQRPKAPMFHGTYIHRRQPFRDLCQRRIHPAQQRLCQACDQIPQYLAGE
ncbi:MAG: hypothetical protein V8Q54_11685 [Alistipes senegalensis]